MPSNKSLLLTLSVLVVSGRHHEKSRATVVVSGPSRSFSLCSLRVEPGTANRYTLLLSMAARERFELQKLLGASSMNRISDY